MEIRNIHDTNNIVVTVEGGLVQSIDNIPPGMTVEVWDFDTENSDEEHCDKTTDGELFVASSWSYSKKE